MLKTAFDPLMSNSSVADLFLTCRSVGDQHCSSEISYDVAADQWLVVTSVPLPSRQSVGFHFISQLLDQVDVGLQMATVDIRSLAARFPLHGVSSIILCTYRFY